MKWSGQHIYDLVSRFRDDVYISGNVGIGTTSPEALLHLESAGDAALIIRADVGNSGEQDNPLIHLQQDFITAGTDGVMVDTKFGIVGSAGEIFTNSLINATYITAQGSITGGNADTGIIQFATGGNNGQDTSATGALASARMTILPDGNVGIGTSAPGNRILSTTGCSLLEIAGTPDASDDGATLVLRNLDTSIATDVIGSIKAVGDDLHASYTSEEGLGAEIKFQSVGTWGNNGSFDYPTKIAFLTNDGTTGSSSAFAERMSIMHSGNVGIGTTAPKESLHINTVAGNSTDAWALRVGNTMDGSNLGRTGVGFAGKDGSDYTKCGIMFEGISSGYNRGKLHFLQENTGDTSEATIADDVAMTIDSTGNVGIGTTDPDTKLEVNGSFAANGPSSTFVTFADGDTSPDVSGGNIFKTHANAYASGVNITQFDGGICGQIITIITGGALVYDVTSSELKGGTTNITTATGDVTMWVCESATVWHLISWMDLSANLSSGGF